MEKYYVCHFNFWNDDVKLLIAKFDTADMFDDNFISSDHFIETPIKWNTSTKYMNYSVVEKYLFDTLQEAYRHLIKKTFTD